MTVRQLPACLVLLLVVLPGAAAPADTATILNQAVAAATRGDFAVAYCLLRPLADRGQADAQYHLGWMYANGEGLALDEEQAVKLWMLAARQGHEEAQFRVAMAYLHGEGVERNPGLAVEWLHELALRGDDDSRDMLLQLVWEQDPKAVEMFTAWLKSASRGLGAERVVKVEKANLRDGPGKDHRVVAVVKGATRMVEIGRTGNWVNVGVLGEGVIAWLHDSLIE